mgnify:FL=1
MKKNKISKDWLIRQKRDPFFKQSKIQGFRSRSAYKLIEMNQRYKFLKKNSKVLDLGSCPGGWSQVVSKETIEGKILAVDIKNMEKINNVDFIKGDFCDENIYKKIFMYFDSKIDVVLSDMAADTSGNKSLDSYRTGELCIKAMNLAKEIMSQNGVFLCKLFMGSIFKEIDDTAKKNFRSVIKYKPKSSKKESKELYIFCKGILKI